MLHYLLNVPVDLGGPPFFGTDFNPRATDVTTSKNKEIFD